MIHTGLVSVTFRKLAPKIIIDLAAKSGLEGIEWGGDIHVPHGDIEVAREVSKMTEDSGLKTVSYGSYYEVGVSPKEGLEFKTVLDTAVALGAPMVRVWAGNKNSEEVDKDFWDAVVGETIRIAQDAKSANIVIAFEYHVNSLTNTPQSTKRLLEQLEADNICCYWQPIVGVKPEENVDGLGLILDKVQHIHVFHWWPDYTQRFPLSTGWDDWCIYIQKLYNDPKERFMMLEFVKDDSTKQFLADMKTLKKLIHTVC